MPTKFCFEIDNIKHKEDIERFVLKTIKELNKLFKIRLYTPKIYLLKTRKQINQIFGKKTKNWLVGWTDWNSIFILYQKKFESESMHKKEDFYPVLKHELVHLYFKRINHTCKPIWLFEGLAVYIAKQNISKNGIEEIVEIIKFFKDNNEKIYSHGGKLVFLLSKRYGKNKLITLIKKINNDMNKKEFSDLFKKVYGFRLNKKELIDHLS